MRRWTARRYRETDRSESTKPSLSSSPWILGAPQDGFSRAILQMSSWISAVILALPGAGPRDRQRQYNRNPARCQLTTVSGFTIKSTSAQRDQTLRNAVQNNRSIRLSLGRGRLRFRTATCWRKARISRARSVRQVKKTLTAVAKSRMNRSMNLPLYHGQVSDSVARQSFGDEQPRTPACDRSHRSAIEAYRYVSDSDLDVEHRQRTNPGRTDASPTSAASADSDAINSPPV